MYQLRAFLFVVFLAFACHAMGQQDTSNGNSWANMPIISDTVKTDTTALPTPIADSIRNKAKIDSMLSSISEREFIKETIKDLCGKGMRGRGYVKDGWDSAAKYILKKFKEDKLQPVVAGGPFAQGFAFPVVSFPGKMSLFLNDDSLAPGATYLIDAASPSYMMDSGKTLRVKKVNLGKKISDTADWNKKLLTFADSSHAYYLTNIDDLAEKLSMRKDQLITQLPKGCFIIPEEKKLTWTVHREPIAATVFYIQEDSLPKKLKHVAVNVESVYNPHQRSENIIACMPGAVKDTYVVFTAHYDHLGMMGSKTVFQGASDNASGTAMLLYLASYYSKHPQHYSMLFIAFGAEEASLMGSEFYVWHPFVPLKNIKFLTNIDIMGDATNGITVVNATANPVPFAKLEQINEKHKYLRVIVPRDNAANSDHYYFAKTHVPCFFMYSNGGNGYYHDIYDVKTSLSLNHIGGVARLLIDFVEDLKDIPTTFAAAPADNAAAPAEMPTTPPADGTVPPKEEEPSPKPQETPEK